MFPLLADISFTTAHAFVTGVVGVYDILRLLPWPTPADIFKGVIGSFISFLILWKPRDFAERRWLRRRFGRKRAVRPPDQTDTAKAAAISSNMFPH